MTLDNYNALKGGALVRHHDGHTYRFKKPYGKSKQFAICISTNPHDTTEYQFLYSSLTEVK